MKFAAHDRGTARTLIRATPSGTPANSRPHSAPATVDGRLYGVSVTANSRNIRASGGFGAAAPTYSPRTAIPHGESANSARPGRGVNFTYDQGQRLFSQGDGGGLFYVVRSGCIRLYKTLPDGRSINLGLLGPNTIFTQEDRSDGLATGLIAEALVDSTVSVIEQDDLTAMIAQSPELAVALVEGMTRRLTDVQGLVEQILARDVSLRLATMLLALAERFGRPLSDADTRGLSKIGIPVPHQLLANMIGSNRVTVTRKLNDLRTEGLVCSLGRNLIAVDMDKLRAYIQTAQAEGEAGDVRG
ncbi:MAG TPA: Crp/Fnr family transcriptional regulator [Thermomicrobiales bacterium]|nr:Crp/Fnr family transcriptional regulator [Thermomicrobiales bacterium]